VSKFLIYVAF